MGQTSDASAFGAKHGKNPDSTKLGLDGPEPDLRPSWLIARVRFACSVGTYADAAFEPSFQSLVGQIGHRLRRSRVGDHLPTFDDEAYT